MLKAIPPLHHAGAGQHSVQLVAYVAPGDYGDAQLLALLGAPGQLGRKHLGIADDRKAAEAHGHAVFDMRRRRPGSGHLAQQRLVANAVHSGSPLGLPLFFALLFLYSFLFWPGH